MRVWIDITNSPHVLFFRPLLRLLQEDGHEVEVTAREFAQTLELLELNGIEHRVVGPAHGGGASSARRGRWPAGCRRCAASRRAAASISCSRTDRTKRCSSPAASASRVRQRTTTSSRPCSTSWASAPQAASSSRTPSRPSACSGSAPGRQLVQYPGLEEEYYLADFEPDSAVLDGIDPAKVLAVVRTPPDVSLYHRHENPLFAQVLDRLGRDEATHAVVLPRTAEQRRAIRGLQLPSLDVPDHAVDAQSLVALADLVVSAGGTMNREAVALGTPVYTTFAGRLGAVDEALIRAGGLTADDRARP